MGSFITAYGREYSEYHPSEELASRMEELFWRGGMMQYDLVSLYGIRIYTLKRGRIAENKRNKGIFFTYNYFEDSRWEDAGYNAENGHVVSEKVGSSSFAKATYAAYVLEGLYTKTPLIPLYNGEMLNRKIYIGWINYLFHEHYPTEQPDAWDYFVFLHKHHPEKEQDEDFLKDVHHYSAYDDGVFCTYAVLHGVEEALQHVKEYTGRPIPENGLAITTLCRKLLYRFNDFQNNCNIPKEEQADYLISEIRKFYVDDAYLKNDTLNEAVKSILIITLLIGNPSLTVKRIAEIYNRNFWEIWDKIKSAYQNNCWKETDKETELFTTMELFHRDADAMIPYWTNDGDIVFSDELQNWFASLKSIYNSMLSKNDDARYTLREILEMLEQADTMFHRIYVFEEFLNETIESLSSEQYQILWKLFAKLLHDAKNSDNQKEGRMLLRNFLALCGNRELRYKVFGF